MNIAALESIISPLEIQELKINAHHAYWVLASMQATMLVAEKQQQRQDSQRVLEFEQQIKATIRKSTELAQQLATNIRVHAIEQMLQLANTIAQNKFYQLAVEIYHALVDALQLLLAATLTGESRKRKIDSAGLQEDAEGQPVVSAQKIHRSVAVAYLSLAYCYNELR